MAGLVLAAAIVAGVLVASHERRTASPPPPTISSVQVWMDVTGHGHALDNPGETKNVFGDATTTGWQTDPYGPADPSHFGGLYDGEGLAIHLTSSQDLASLVVESPSKGWAARTYVAEHFVPSGSPLTDWGQPTATKTGINGDATFDLKGRKGQWVLFWLTDLGPPFTTSAGLRSQVTITHVTVKG